MSAIVAEEDRLAAVCDHARLQLPTGMFEDNQALERAEELGLVERHYQGPLAMLGLSHLHLTPLGAARGETPAAPIAGRI